MSLVPPKLRPHNSTIHCGKYFRNLTDDEIARQYRDLDAGYRLKLSSVKNWDWTELSVNQRECCGCQPSTSLELLVKPHKYVHVWEVDLEQLNSYLAGTDELVATYDPTPESSTTLLNPCHFLVHSFNGILTLNQILQIFEHLENKIPPIGAKHPKKAPKNHSAEMMAAIDEYCSVVKIHRNCNCSETC